MGWKNSNWSEFISTIFNSPSIILVSLIDFLNAFSESPPEYANRSARVSSSLVSNLPGIFTAPSMVTLLV